MIPIIIPDKLNGGTFYGEILPSIYSRIIQGDYSIDFDMHRTELANPEGLVNLLAAAAMIRSKSGHIPQLYLPESPKLFEYMRRSGFFRWATVPGCESLKFNSFRNIDFDDEYRRSNYFRPQLYGLFTHSIEGTTFNGHIKHIEDFVIEIADSLVGKDDDTSEISHYFLILLSRSLVQVIKNALEHNLGYRGVLAYYMIQKTPYNTIEFVCSDIGKGFLERMKEMLNEKDPEAITKYGHLEQKLNNRDLLFKEDKENPNLLAIINAVKFREGSRIPGLHMIKKFVIDNDGLFSIHSGNYTVSYSNGNEEKSIFHDESYFSGAHLKMVLNLPNQQNQNKYE